MIEDLCKESGHLLSNGTVTIDKDELKVYDICKRCKKYFIRGPTQEEINEYGRLLDYSANLKL